MGLIEPFKKWKRSLDIYITLKRFVFFSIFFIITLYYIFPYLGVFKSRKSDPVEGSLTQCLEDHLSYLHSGDRVKNFEFRPNSFDIHNQYSPFIGNGYFGISFSPTPRLLIKESRTLSYDLQWSPLLSVNPQGVYKEVYYTDVISGIVRRVQCFSTGLLVSYVFFAHRTNPNLMYQDVFVYNPTDHPILVQYFQDKYPKWISSNSVVMGTSDSNGVNHESRGFIGIVKNHSNNEVTAACIGFNFKPTNEEIPPHRTVNINFPVVIHTEIMSKAYFGSRKTQLEGKCKETMSKAQMSGSLYSQQEHVSTWNNLWNSGLSISHSRAFGALNNHHINATVYYVLSNVLMNKTDDSGLARSNINSSYISVAEGCYGGYHHTLQANNLWRGLNNFNKINSTVSLWLLTLDKQGCHKLLRTGAAGVLQALILSFGGFRFNPHHLEFKIDPKFLHRDYYFRKIQIEYGVNINVSVILQEDNKALLGVAIDKSGKDYYACDGGCIDSPVQLRTTETFFPVKITEPITSILYITSDKSHIELIKDTLHVHKVVEAPAHDHTVLALHRHGSQLGGLPMMFWLFFIPLILIFHLFICKMICNEFNKKQDRVKIKYSRV